MPDIPLSADGGYGSGGDLTHLTVPFADVDAAGTVSGVTRKGRDDSMGHHADTVVHAVGDPDINGRIDTDRLGAAPLGGGDRPSVTAEPTIPLPATVVVIPLLTWRTQMSLLSATRRALFHGNCCGTSTDFAPKK